MFVTYLRRELRRRMRQSVFIAIGLALGIGLVITVTAASTGVSDAQGTVLHSLYGVGTDITVTQSPAAGSASPGRFGFRGAFGAGRPKAGTKVHVDTLSSLSLGTLSASSVTSVSKLKGVAAAAGGLTLTDTVVNLTIPNFSASGGGPGRGSGGKASNGGNGGQASGGGGRFRGAFKPTSFGVEGVDLSEGELGPLSSGRLTAGRTFTSADATSNVAVVDSNYATQKKLKVGSTVTVAKKKFKVIGIVSGPQASNPPDVYIPLARAQALASPSLKGKVNTVYVAATSATQTGAVSREISHLLPKATVTDTSDLAGQVTGSLASASSLANNLGRWLAIAVLAAAFGLASLLTMSAVSRRVREFGTLKALGWRSRRIIGQVMGEAVVTGVIGGVVGIALGFGGAALVSAFAPPLSASLGLNTGSATPGGARSFAGGGPGGGFRQLAEAGHSVAVHLAAPVTIDAVLLAVGLAILGGLIAGSFGGWRAARLRPAAALSRVE